MWQKARDFQIRPVLRREGGREGGKEGGRMAEREGGWREGRREGERMEERGREGGRRDVTVQYSGLVPEEKHAFPLIPLSYLALCNTH